MPMLLCLGLLGLIFLVGLSLGSKLSWVLLRILFLEGFLPFLESLVSILDVFHACNDVLQ